MPSRSSPPASAISATVSLLAGQSLTLSLSSADATGAGGTTLRRCLLANGNGNVTINEDKTGNRRNFVVDQQTAQAIRASLLKELDRDETMAMVFDDEGPSAEASCH